MQTFFVIDALTDVDKKINMILNNVGGDIKFFVKADLYTKIIGNNFIAQNLAGVYKSNEKLKIDKYLQTDKCNLDDTLLYYSSVEVNEEVLRLIREKSSYGYDSVFVSPKRNWWEKFTNWVYKKTATFMYRTTDLCCSSKIQYIGKRFLEYLKETTFSNHIFDVQHKYIVEVTDKSERKSLHTHIKFSKYYLYDIVALLLILLGYVLLETFFDLPFFVYFAVVLSVILAIIIAIMISCFSKFNSRIRFSRNGEE